MSKRNANNSKPDPLDSQLARRRICLVCDHQFLSSGPGNRICPRCSHRRRTDTPVHTHTLRG
ncbi:MAG TPA: hypothetical protein PLC79_11880 [Phycisphaerae bacterium]|nr:hypothetical protein [Phycisphaerae bacterium]